MTLKLRILRSLTRLFIILVSLTRSLFSDKMAVSNRCISGLMPNLINKSWKVSSTYLALKHIGGHACTSLIWTDICGIAAGKSCEKILQHNNCRRWIGARVQYSYLNLTREIDPSKLQTIELIMLCDTDYTNQMSLFRSHFFST